MSGDKKPPDYNVSALVRGTEIKGNVGVAWKNEENGRITVRIDTFIVLKGGPDLFVTLFPRDAGPRTDGRSGGRRGGISNQEMDDDIPF